MNGTAMQTKGSTFRSTLDFILAERGAESLERVLAAVASRIRELAEVDERAEVLAVEATQDGRLALEAADRKSVV